MFTRDAIRDSIQMGSQEGSWSVCEVLCGLDREWRGVWVKKVHRVTELCKRYCTSQG